MRKVIHLVDGGGKFLFDLSDGDFLRMDSPNGDNITIRCNYLDDTRMLVDGTEQIISQFVSRMLCRGVWLRPVGSR